MKIKQQEIVGLLNCWVILVVWLDSNWHAGYMGKKPPSSDPTAAALQAVIAQNDRLMGILEGVLADNKPVEVIKALNAPYHGTVESDGGVAANPVLPEDAPREVVLDAWGDPEISLPEFMEQFRDGEPTPTEPQYASGLLDDVSGDGTE